MSRRNNYEPRFSGYSDRVDYTRLGVDKNQCQMKFKGGKIKMLIPIKEHKKIPDGEHEGIILTVDYRTQPLSYTDYNLAFNVDNERVTVKASYPTNITPETIHGRMLARFGLQIAAGLNVDPDKLIGLKVQFTTVNKTTPKGTFPEVMRETLKPLPIQVEKTEYITDTQQNNPDQPRTKQMGTTPGQPL